MYSSPFVGVHINADYVSYIPLHIEFISEISSTKKLELFIEENRYALYNQFMGVGTKYNA